MDREELFLKQKFGNERPFRVPEGYFDSFADNLMKELPEREANEAKVVPMRRRLSWRKFATVAVAACLGVVLLNVGTTYFNHEQQAQQPLAASMQSAAASNEAFDQMADYAMIDVSDMYAYVSDY
jgi:hypothetical protein